MLTRHYHWNGRIRIGFAALLALLCAGCEVLLPPVPHHPLKGLWREVDRSNNYYLVVEPDADEDRHQTPYQTYTNVPWLINTRDDWGRISDDTGVIGQFNVTGNVARLTGRGRTIVLRRDSHVGVTLWERYASYGSAIFKAGVLYPDGFSRLLILYIICLSIVATSSSDNLPEGTQTDQIPLIGVFVLLALVTPFVGSYLIGGLKWLFLGYWDPFLVGRLEVYAITIVIILSLAAPIGAIRSFKSDTQGQFRGSLRPITFWLLVGVDLVGVGGTLRALYEWFR